jgi:hypothetical protein
VGEEVIPSRGEIAATPATIGQKPVIENNPWLMRHTPRGWAATLVCLPEEQPALGMSSAFLMTMP